MLGQDLQGALVAGDVLNNDNALVDELKRMLFKENFEAGAATIYLSETAIASSRSGTFGRGVGETISQDILTYVLKQGKEFIGTETIGDTSYISAYVPIKDIANQIIGIYSVSVRETWFRQFQNYIRNFVIIVIVVAILFSVLLTYITAGRLTADRGDHGGQQDLARRHGRLHQVKSGDEMKVGDSWAHAHSPPAIERCAAADPPSPHTTADLGDFSQSRPDRFRYSRNMTAADRKTAEELRQLMASGAAAFGTQLFRHLYRRQCFDLSAMTDMARPFREELAARASLELPATPTPQRRRLEKFLLAGRREWSRPLIPEEDRRTLCLSTQAGCAMGCGFCATAGLQHRRNLTAGEILGQYFVIAAAAGLAGAPVNIVFMGMGEPLLNYEAVMRAYRLFHDPAAMALSRRGITLSTCGLPDGIRLGTEPDCRGWRCRERRRRRHPQPADARQPPVSPGRAAPGLPEFLCRARITSSTSC
jgi:hypothetical protein